MSTLKTRIQDDMKAALRGQDKDRLGTIRLLLAAMKQIEVDERVTLDDTRILAVLEKMIKQRRESINQYQAAGRQELANKEQAEINVLQEYLPPALSEAEVLAMIDAAIASSGAKSMQEMGKVMALLKPQLQGRADMGQVSGLIKKRLGG